MEILKMESIAQKELETLSGYDVIVENPRRSQMFFLATIEKPRSIDEVAKIWNVSRGTFFSRGLDKKMIKAKLLRVVGYEKRALKFEANFEGLADYLKKSAEAFLSFTQKSEDSFNKSIEKHFGKEALENIPSFSSLLKAFIESLPNLILILDTKEVRSLFSDDFVKSIYLRKFFFNDKFFLFKLFSNFLEETSFISRIFEKSEKENWDDLKIRNYLALSVIYLRLEMGLSPIPLVYRPDNYQVVKQIKGKINSLPFYNEYINFQRELSKSQKNLYEEVYELMK
jgi:hypothetical protein